MAATSRSEQAMMRTSAKLAETATDPLEKLRCQILARGAGGIRGIARVFKIMDDDNSRSLWCAGAY